MAEEQPRVSAASKVKDYWQICVLPIFSPLAYFRLENIISTSKCLKPGLGQATFVQSSKTSPIPTIFCEWIDSWQHWVPFRRVDEDILTKTKISSAKVSSASVWIPACNPEKDSTLLHPEEITAENIVYWKNSKPFSWAQRQDQTIFI